MKKYMPIIMAIVIGIIFGNIIFNSYEEEAVMSNDGSIYILQYGAYTNESVLKENIKTLANDSYIVDKVLDTYYVYFGVTTNYYNALNIVKLYEDKGIFLYIKENYLGKTNLINKLKTLDSLIKNESNNEMVLNYAKESLTIYQNNY